MAIGNAVQRDAYVEINDENGHTIAVISGRRIMPGDGLKGYTSTTVSVQLDGIITTYDEKGHAISATRAG